MLRPRTASVVLLIFLTVAPAYSAVRRHAVQPPNGMRWVDRVFLVILENENAGAALQPAVSEAACRHRRISRELPRVNAPLAAELHRVD